MSILKRAAFLSMIGLASTISAVSLFGTQTTEVRRGRFGAMEVIDWTETGMNKEVHLPTKKFIMDYIR